MHPSMPVLTYSTRMSVRIATAVWKMRLLLRGRVRRIDVAKRLLSTPSLRARRRACGTYQYVRHSTLKIPAAQNMLPTRQAAATAFPAAWPKRYLTG